MPSSQCLAFQPRRCRKLGRVRLEVALADHELVQGWWLGSGSSVALIGKDVECDEMAVLISHEGKAVTPGITKPGGAVPTVHLPTHGLAANMYALP